MAGSEAEERIRAKAEASLRRAFPDARIIHELVVGACRLDLAAVTPDQIIMAEIKSERDVLKRMVSQLSSAARITRDVRIYVTAKHRDEVWRGRQFVVDGKINENRLEILEKVYAFVESEKGLELLTAPTGLDRTRSIEPRDVWQLMWSEEMRAVLRGLGVTCSRAAQREMTMDAVEHMTGRQIRQAVCAALRQRSFPRADPKC